MCERTKVKRLDVNGCINDARNALQYNSHDVAHGVEHHQNVADNVDCIINAEGIRHEVNYGALKVAAWWHDYDRHSGDYSVMTKSLEEHGATPEFIGEVTKIIDGHSDLDSNKPLSKEQTILILADKIEYVDLDRYKSSLVGMGWAELKVSQFYWKSKIKKVLKLMNTTEYRSARDLFYKKLENLYDYVKNEKPEDLHWFKGLI